MCVISEPQLKNLVVFFRVPKEDIPKLIKLPAAQDFGKTCRNFFVLRLDNRGNICQSRVSKKRGERRGLSFTIFPNKGGVIVTGLATETEISSALTSFANVAKVGKNTPPVEWFKKTVNSTLSGSVSCFKTDLSLYHLLENSKERLRVQKKISVNFRTHSFPGILVKWDGLAGSANLFDNGQYVIVGAKSSSQTKDLYDKLCALIHDCWMTMPREMSCVLNVDKLWIESTAITVADNVIDTKLAI